MNSMNYEMAKFLSFLGNNPIALLHFLACACAITLVIAIVTDAFLAQRQSAGDRKTLENRPKPRTDLTLRPPTGLQMAKAGGASLPRDAKRSKF
jgi:hypothetical protein